MTLPRLKLVPFLLFMSELFAPAASKIAGDISQRHACTLETTLRPCLKPTLPLMPGGKDRHE